MLTKSLIAAAVFLIAYILLSVWGYTSFAGIALAVFFAMLAIAFQNSQDLKKLFVYPDDICRSEYRHVLPAIFSALGQL